MRGGLVVDPADGLRTSSAPNSSRHRRCPKQTGRDADGEPQSCTPDNHKMLHHFVQPASPETNRSSYKLMPESGQGLATRPSKTAETSLQHRICQPVCCRVLVWGGIRCQDESWTRAQTHTSNHHTSHVDYRRLSGDSVGKVRFVSLRGETPRQSLRQRW